VKIAITHPYAWPAVRRGAERMVVEMTRSLAARGHSVTVFTSGRPDIPGGRVVGLRRLHPRDDVHELAFGLRVAPHLLAGRFDAVHSLMPCDAAAAVLTARVAGHRVVYEELGIPDPDYWRQRRDGRIRHWLVPRVDVYACMSEYAAAELQRVFGRPAVVVPGGVRLAEFEPARREPTPTVLFSGALSEPRKGLADLLQAVALLLPGMPELRLWLSGPGDVSAQLARLPGAVRAAVEVLPLGGPHEQSGRYSRAWVTALPSVRDSFGLVLIESLAAGTPIVVSNDAAPPSLVSKGTGAIAEPGDAVSLAAALREALELARRPETAERCRRSAAAFDWDAAIAPRLEDLYSGRAPLEAAA